MKIISPIDVTESVLVSSNVPEDDAPAWSASTSYAQGDQVVYQHGVYHSAQDVNVGQVPGEAPGVWWTFLTETNPWRAFNKKLGQGTSSVGQITFELVPPTLVTAIAFFGLGAAQVQVIVRDSGGHIVFDETQNTVDTSDLVNWFAMFTTELNRFQDKALFTNIPGFPENTVEIIIGTASGTAFIGEVIPGRLVSLGETVEGSSIGLQSFSLIKRDEFGNFSVTKRAKSQPMDFQFAMEATDGPRVRRELGNLLDSLAVYFADETLVKSHGAMTYGLLQNVETPLQKAGKTIIDLEIEGAT